ncbi:hypothetical protein NDU88_003029 [Pleurodeles waltl]|uniref:Uncharacterized protein n=1 Tax=Pleurodeles waltl TaxID=8319 RepID=A0AAV7UCM1_PLEWA|nr:hypothetical protein NDU88_003029 [Pleurodeles waltl]
MGCSAPCLWGRRQVCVGPAASRPLSTVRRAVYSRSGAQVAAERLPTRLRAKHLCRPFFLVPDPQRARGGVPSGWRRGLRSATGRISQGHSLAMRRSVPLPPWPCAVPGHSERRGQLASVRKPRRRLRTPRPHSPSTMLGAGSLSIPVCYVHAENLEMIIILSRDGGRVSGVIPWL